MSKFFLFSKHNMQKRQPTTKKWYHDFAGNYFQLNAICLVSLIVLFISYIGLVNYTSSDGFEVSQMQKKIETIEEANRELELTVQNLQSMEHIKTISENLNFEQVKDVAFLSSSSAMALNE